jgi:hypothetical protein
MRPTEPRREARFAPLIGPGLAGQNPDVVLPAFCDLPLGSVDQRSWSASTCAAPDLIADVSALTSAHTLRSHRTRTMLTSRPVEAAPVEPVVSANKHTKQPKVVGTEAARLARSESPPKCSHRSPVSAGKSGPPVV